MNKRKRKTIKIVLAIALSLIAGYFIVNSYLNHRIEAILKRELGKAVSNASDGFYKLSFDYLSVGFFNGELSIKGIELIPDSAVFKEWEMKDSLPEIYYNIKVGTIDFKGVNLAWSFNYKDLRFGLFEIKNSQINITSAYLSSRYQVPQTKNRSQLDLYEMISPYIRRLSVNKINLENVTALYTVEDPVVPSRYGLKEINFVAYNFLLDEYSSQSGKLLYCDDFEFVVDRPQTLLSDSHFNLDADSIRLSTKDSLIHIKGIHLKPQEDDWENRTTRQGNYIDAAVKAVEVKGVYFKREKGLNYLNARSFDIKSSDINFYTVNEKDSVDKRKEVLSVNDTIIAPWSLYTIISPVLHSVLIEKIGVEDTGLKYYVTQGQYTDSYTMDDFFFRANNFWVDSLVDTRNQFWHSESYILEAKGIKGDMPSKNIRAGLERFLLNTIDGRLSLSKMSLSPISTNVSQDYITGTIELVDVEGLHYDKGLEASLFKIESPKVKYYRMSESSKGARQTETKQQGSRNNILDLFAPYVEYLKIEDIKLSNADLAFYDKVDDNIFRLRDFNFYANSLLMDEHTRKTQRYMFDCKNFGFSFKDFDNYLQGKDYRLLIKEGSFSYRTGRLVFEDIRLIPQEQSWVKAPDIYYGLMVPKIEVKGIDADPNKNMEDIKLGTAIIESPQIKVVKVRQAANREKSSDKDPAFVFRSLSIDAFKTNNADLLYLDKVEKDSLNVGISDFSLSKLNWNAGRNISIGSFMLQMPDIYYSSSQSKSSDKKQHTGGLPDFLKHSIDIEQFTISDANVDIKQPETAFHVDTKSFSFTDLKWDIRNHLPVFAVNTIDIEKPIFKIHQLYKPVKAEKDSTKGSGDLYTFLDDYVSHISVNKFNLSDASLDYSHSLNGLESGQQTTSKNNLLIENLVLSPKDRSMNVDNLKYSANDIRFPLNDGFYTMVIGSVDLDEKKGSLKMDNIHLIPFYAKEKFAYEHPRHKDWFDVSANKVSLSGIDFAGYFANKVLKIDTLNIGDVMFQNFKNQKIEIQHNIMPMIYEGLQNIPIDYYVDRANIKNFNVTYEELTKNGTTPGKIFFTDMNGTLTGLTNIANKPDQYIRLDTDGKFMGAGYYRGIWMLPVSKDYDRFLLEIKVNEFDLRHLNQIFTPMASAEVKSGVAKELGIMMDASSEGGTIGMSFLYNDLKVNVLRNSDHESRNSFMSFLANLAIKSNNPDKEGKEPRRPQITIVRDKYHSTFNYLWQMLQPAAVESVGVSQGKQNFAKKVSKIFSGIKNFFTGGGKKDKDKEEKPTD